MFHPNQKVIVNNQDYCNKEATLIKIIAQETPGSPNAWEVNIDDNLCFLWENEFDASSKL